jgi:SPP1 gp7 family putative phage head morphogenesis protein
MDDMTIYNLMNNIAGGVMSVSPGFVPEDVGWVQYSAIHDAKTCPYCRRLDGMVVSVSHEDYVTGRYDPPQHPNCRCTWIQINASEPDVEEDWNPPDAEEMAAHAADNPAIMSRLSFSRAWEPFISDIEDAINRRGGLNM